MVVRISVVRKDKLQERCWIDKRFKCIHPEYDVRRKCVIACRVYRRWARRLKRTVERLREETARFKEEEPLNDKGRILSW